MAFVLGLYGLFRLVWPRSYVITVILSGKRQGSKSTCSAISQCPYRISKEGRKQSRHNCLSVNTFTPKFMKWPLPALNLDMSTVANGGASQKPKTEWQTL